MTLKYLAFSRRPGEEAATGGETSVFFVVLKYVYIRRFFLFLRFLVLFCFFLGGRCFFVFVKQKNTCQQQ